MLRLDPTNTEHSTVFTLPTTTRTMPRASVPILTVALVVATIVAGNPSQCLLPNGTMAPCGPDNDQCAAHGTFSRGPGVPQFHIMDLSCGEYVAVPGLEA